MSWLSVLVRSLSFILILPLVLRYLPDSDLSLFYSFQFIAGFLLMFFMGIEPNVVRLVSYAQGGMTIGEMSRHPLKGTLGVSRGPNPATLACVVTTSIRLHLILAVLVMTLLLLLGSALLMRPISMIDQPQERWAAWIVFCLGSSTTGFGNCYACVLQGLERIALHRRLEALVLLLGIVAGAAAVVAGFGLLGLVVAQQSVYLLGIAVRGRIVSRLLRQLGVTSEAHRYDKTTAALLVAMSWRSGLGVALHTGVLHLAPVYFVQFRHPSEAAPYLLATKLMLALTEFSRAPFYSKLPRLARLRSEGDRSGQIVLAQRGMRLAYFVFVAGVVSVGMTGDRLLAAIGSNTPFVSVSLWAMLGVAYFVERYSVMHAMFYSVTNHIVWHKVFGAGAAVFCVVFVMGQARLGFFAYPLALLLAELLVGAWVSPGMIYALFSTGLWRFERTVMLPWLAIIIAWALYAQHLG